MQAPPAPPLAASHGKHNTKRSHLSKNTDGRASQVDGLHSILHLQYRGFASSLQAAGEVLRSVAWYKRPSGEKVVVRES